MDEPNAIEASIRASFDSGDLERAATLAIEHYGSELIGFLLHELGDSDAANEVFAEFCEILWETLARFEWRCSMRSWTYKLIRHAAIGYRKRERRRARLQPLTQLSFAVECLRTATAAYQRTDVKDRFRNIREQLSSEDQTLLILRLDRGLSWSELAEILIEDEGPVDRERLKAESARLRKRYQLVKERMRKLLQEEGLL